MLFKDYFASVLLTMVCLTFDTPLLGYSCQNAFQSILQTHQQRGKFPRNSAVKLLGERVISQMECLDLCLRNARCDFFDMKQVYSENSMKHWICSVKQRLSAPDTELVSSRAWFHFNISSHNLQEVSSLHYKIRFCSTIAWTLMMYRFCSVDLTIDFNANLKRYFIIIGHQIQSIKCFQKRKFSTAGKQIEKSTSKLFPKPHKINFHRFSILKKQKKKVRGKDYERAIAVIFFCFISKPIFSLKWNIVKLFPKFAFL